MADQSCLIQFIPIKEEIGNSPCYQNQQHTNEPHSQSQTRHLRIVYVRYRSADFCKRTVLLFLRYPIKVELHPGRPHRIAMNILQMQKRWIVLT
jgi:hypothetical protein